MPVPTDQDPPATLFKAPLQFAEYWIDTVQRSVLFFDALRKRGNEYIARTHEEVPNVLNFEARLVVDGRTLATPVNYGLVEIVPPAGVTIDPARRPFIVVDPRAGHGPGIGGMKADSEIGMALAAGHPCYFVGFTPNPVAGQTVEHVCAAEALFVETVIARHPEASGKPVLIGNCQAGWQIMMTAALRPELFGPIMLAGSPLSYWAGVRGKNPMRYSGGLLGGTWLNALTGDLGNGIFDGAHLVSNFESLNPANTLWAKPYNVFANIDDEEDRFLDFEKWWGNPVLLTAGEMLSIADSLFVGNKLSHGGLATADGKTIDLRNITSPIIVFCSWGDDITPPPQALRWIIDLYGRDADVVASGQTIVYCLHQSIGHLGIFVSGKVATKEHGEFARAMEAIDLLAPGVYEAVITDIDDKMAHPELIGGDFLMTLNRRTLDDVREICQPNPEDDRRFETAKRLSDVNLALYDATLGPVVRMMSTDTTASMMREMHPNRLRFAMFSDKNPMMATVSQMADAVRQNRQPAASDNPWAAAEHRVAGVIEGGLKNYGKAMDAAKEATFLAIYGNPLVQTLAGIDRETSQGPRQDSVHSATGEQHDREVLDRMMAGGAIAAVTRALVHVANAIDAADERIFAAYAAALKSSADTHALGAAELRSLMHDQQTIMRIAPELGLAAIPAMLETTAPAQRIELGRKLGGVLRSGAPIPEAAEARLAAMLALIGAPGIA